MVTATELAQSAELQHLWHAAKVGVTAFVACSKGRCLIVTPHSLKAVQVLFRPMAMTSSWACGYLVNVKGNFVWATSRKL